MNSKASQKEKAGYNKWTPEMDRVCMDTLLEELKKGGKGDNGWKPQSYQAVINDVQEKLGVPLTKENVRSRLKTWRTWYTTIINLTNTSGFGWNNAKKMIEADDISWKNYLQSHPSAASYRFRSFNDFDDISLIIGNDQATGTGALNGIDAEIADRMGGVDGSVGLEEIGDDEIDQPPFSAQPPSPTPATTSPATSSSSKGSKSKKRIRKEFVDEEMASLNSSLKDIANAIRDVSSSVDTSRVVEELMKTPGLTDDQIVRAINYIGVDKRRADIFFSLSGALRKRWLELSLD